MNIEGEADVVNNDRHGPLHGIRVLDVSTVYAAPITAMLLGDFGADVVKIEHPAGDPARSHGSARRHSYQHPITVPGAATPKHPG